jgi:hypothetical protein
MAEIGIPLLISLNCGGDLFPLLAQQRQAYFRYQLLASRYLLFAAGALLKWIGHIFWLKPLKPVFCDLKSKFLLN